MELSPKEEHSYSFKYTGSSSDNKSIHRRSIDKNDCQNRVVQTMFNIAQYSLIWQMEQLLIWQMLNNDWFFLIKRYLSEVPKHNNKYNKSNGKHWLYI